jgi:hypothetical protein
MKLSILSALAVTALAATCSALTVDVTTVYGFNTNKPISDSTGTAIPVGNRIEIGRFDTTGYATAIAFFTANESDLPTLMSHFTGVSSKTTLVGKSDLDWVFGVTAKSTTAAAAGCFTMSVGPTISGTALENKKLYLVIFKTTDNSTNLGPNYWNVSEYGVFSSSNTDWVFKSDTDPSAKITLRTNQIDQFYISTDSALETYAYGAKQVGALWSTESNAADQKSTSWYGAVWPVQYGNGWFVSSANAAWQYAVGGSDGIWIFDFTLGWTWTSEYYYPYTYLYDIKEWAYFYGISGGVRQYCVFDSALSASLQAYPLATDAELGVLRNAQ